MAKNGSKTGVNVTDCNFYNIAKRIEKMLVVTTDFATKCWGWIEFVLKIFVKSQQKAFSDLFDF